jgi:hypothetical protein
VHDVGIAIAAIVTSDESDGVTYELGGPKVFTMKQLTDMMYSLIREKPNTLSVPNQLAKVLRLTGPKAETLSLRLGWPVSRLRRKPVVSLTNRKPWWPDRGRER